MLTQAHCNHIVHECQVCGLCHTTRIGRKGEHVFREGETADYLFVLRSGSIKSYLVTEDGQEQVLDFYLPGDILGLDTNEMQQRRSSAISLETTSVCRFPHAYLSEKSQGTNLLKTTAEQLQRDHNLLVMLARKDAGGRIASFLDDLAGRYWSRGYSASVFMLTMSRQDIGCYLGLAVETVSRALTRLQDCGVLRVNRREVEILDHDTLRKIAGAQVCAPAHRSKESSPLLSL